MTSAQEVNGPTLGGDDYVTKPFCLPELIARIQAVLRRATGAPSVGILVVADLTLDPAAREVTRMDRPIRLSPNEFKLLHCLMARAGHVVRRSQILEEVWRYDFAGDTSIVDAYVSYLCRKVDGVEPKVIHRARRRLHAARPAAMNRLVPRSLRARLLLITTVLVVRIVVSDAVVSVALRGHLIDRVDRQLQPIALAMSRLDPALLDRSTDARPQTLTGVLDLISGLGLAIPDRWLRRMTGGSNCGRPRAAEPPSGSTCHGWRKTGNSQTFPETLSRA